MAKKISRETEICLKHAEIMNDLTEDIIAELLSGNFSKVEQRNRELKQYSTLLDSKLEEAQYS